MTTHQIAASILSANFAALGDEVEHVLKAGADMIHFDVMDNHFVPNLSIGPMVCAALRDHGITAPIDVHLMVQPVDRLIEDFAKAGATTLSIHASATDHVEKSIDIILDNGAKAGLAFNPDVSLDILPNLIDKLDLVVIMSVNPGFGGQKFIQATYDKIKTARAIIDQSKRNIRLEVDGGINQDNIAAAAKAGADLFVVGSALFHTPDYHQTISALRTELAKDCL